MTPPTLSCSSADRDPLQNLDVSTSFGFLQVLLDVQQQDLHRVNSILDVRDTVQDGERSSDVFTEQRLSAQRADRTQFEKFQRKLCCRSEWVKNSVIKILGAWLRRKSSSKNVLRYTNLCVTVRMNHLDLLWAPALFGLFSYDSKIISPDFYRHIQNLDFNLYYSSFIN